VIAERVQWSSLVPLRFLARLAFASTVMAIAAAVFLLVGLYDDAPRELMTCLFVGPAVFAGSFAAIKFDQIWGNA